MGRVSEGGGGGAGKSGGGPQQQQQQQQRPHGGRSTGPRNASDGAPTCGDDDLGPLSPSGNSLLASLLLATSPGVMDADGNVNRQQLSLGRREQSWKAPLGGRGGGPVHYHGVRFLREQQQWQAYIMDGEELNFGYPNPDPISTYSHLLSGNQQGFGNGGFPSNHSLPPMFTSAVAPHGSTPAQSHRSSDRDRDSEMTERGPAPPAQGQRPVGRPPGRPPKDGNSGRGRGGGRWGNGSGRGRGSRAGAVTAAAVASPAAAAADPADVVLGKQGSRRASAGVALAVAALAAAEDEDYEYGDEDYEDEEAGSGSDGGGVAIKQEQHGRAEGGGGGGGKRVSRYRGVAWDEGEGQWRAQVWDGSHLTVLGHFSSQEAAARAFDEAEIQGGRRDRLNFGSHQPGGSAVKKTKRALSSGTLAVNAAADTLLLAGLPTPPAPLFMPSGTTAHGAGHPLPRAAKSERVVHHRATPPKVTSQYKGVSWNSACSKWVAVLWDRELKRARHIGSYESEEEAARAYDREATRMLGTDAGLNFREKAAEYLIEVGAHPVEVGAHAKGSSQYRGVSWHERSQRWEVRVWGGGKQHFIGSFTAEGEAARSYDMAVLRLRGQDARSRSRMNFPVADYDLDALAQEPPLVIPYTTEKAGKARKARPKFSDQFENSDYDEYEDEPHHKRAASDKHHNHNHNSNGSAQAPSQGQRPASQQQQQQQSHPQQQLQHPATSNSLNLGTSQPHFPKFASHASPSLTTNSDGTHGMNLTSGSVRDAGQAHSQQQQQQHSPGPSFQVQNHHRQSQQPQPPSQQQQLLQHLQQQVQQQQQQQAPGLGTAQVAVFYDSTLGKWTVALHGEARMMSGQGMLAALPCSTPALSTPAPPSTHLSHNTHHSTPPGGGNSFIGGGSNSGGIGSGSGMAGANALGGGGGAAAMASGGALDPLMAQALLQIQLAQQRQRVEMQMQLITQQQAALAMAQPPSLLHPQMVAPPDAAHAPQLRQSDPALPRAPGCRNTAASPCTPGQPV
ncbi:MAG: hypothetical protein WDW36_005432 [Sanguina aurantia]